MNRVVKVLAVADPAVFVYTDKKLGILSEFKKAEVQFDIVAWENYYPAILAALEGNADYDIVMIAGHLWLRDFAEKDYLCEIDEHDSDILPIIAEEMKYNSRTYLSPSFCDGHMVVYRKSILKKYNIDFENVITVDELIHAVKTINNLPKDIKPIALKAHPSEIFLDALPYLRHSGIDIYDGKTYEINCNNEHIIDGLEKYLSLAAFAPSDTKNYGNNEIKEAIAKKQVAIGVTWSGQLGVVVDDGCIDPKDLGFATFNTAWNVTWSFAISSKSKNKVIAKELLQYLISKPVDKIVGEYCGAPVRRSSYIEGRNKYEWYRCQLKMIEECAKPFPNIKNAGEKNSVLYEEIYKALTGEKDAKMALCDAQMRIDQISQLD